MQIFGHVIIKFEWGFVQCFGCGYVVFLNMPGTATIICIHSETENLIYGFSNFDLKNTLGYVIFKLVLRKGAILKGLNL